MNSCYEYMQRDLEFQQKIKKRLENELKKKMAANKDIQFDGHYLTSRVIKGRRYYYDAQRVNKKEKVKYIGNAENPEVVARQELHYLEKTLNNCNSNIKYLQMVIDKYRPIDPESVVSSSGKAYQGSIDVVSNIFRNTNTSEWRERGLDERCKLEAQRPFPDGLVLRTASGELVRTRGEIIIADTLDSFGLTYVYEWPRMIAGILRWPDFTILHPKTKEEITIEYMGRYDDPGYREKNNPRLDEFFSEGYILGQNLLVFMDDADGIIDSNKIHRIIRALFVD